MRLRGMLLLVAAGILAACASTGPSLEDVSTSGEWADVEPRAEYALSYPRLSGVNPRTSGVWEDAVDTAVSAEKAGLTPWATANGCAGNDTMAACTGESWAETGWTGSVVAQRFASAMLAVRTIADGTNSASEVAHTFNFDTELGQPLSLNAFVRGGRSALIPMVRDAGQTELCAGWSTSEGVLDDSWSCSSSMTTVSDGWEELDAWTLSEAGLRLWFDKGEVAGEATGITWVDIPWADLASHLTPLADGFPDAPVAQRNGAGDDATAGSVTPTNGDEWVALSAGEICERLTSVVDEELLGAPVESGPTSIGGKKTGCRIWSTLLTSPVAGEESLRRRSSYSLVVYDPSTEHFESETATQIRLDREVALEEDSWPARCGEGYAVFNEEWSGYEVFGSYCEDPSASSINGRVWLVKEPDYIMFTMGRPQWLGEYAASDFISVVSDVFNSR